MRNKRDGLVVFLKSRQEEVEFDRFVVKRGNIAKERRLKSIKDEVVIPVKPRIIENRFRLSPGVNVVADKSMNEDDDIFRLKDLVPQVQIPLVMWLLGKPVFLHPLGQAFPRGRIAHERTGGKFRIIRVHHPRT